MLPLTIFQTKSHLEAQKGLLGCVPTAQPGKSTAIQRRQETEPGDSVPQAVPTVLVTRLANATRCTRTTHSWPQSGILPRMRAHLTTIQHTLPIWLGGHLRNTIAGSRAFLIVQNSLTAKNRGAMSNSMACR